MDEEVVAVGSRGCRRLQFPLTRIDISWLASARGASGAIFPLTAMMDLPVHQYTYAPAPISSYANACACRARSYCSTMIPKGILGFHAMAYSSRQLLTPISVLMCLSSASFALLYQRIKSSSQAGCMALRAALHADASSPSSQGSCCSPRLGSFTTIKSRC